MTPRLGLALGVAGLPLQAYAQIARQADDAGVDTVCVGEAHHDSFVSAAMAAQATTRARVLTSITTWARPPVLTAMAATSVDELSGGRFALGLGTMPAAWNRDWFGIDPSRPVERMREYVAVVRAALSGGPVTTSGEWFHVEGWRRLGPPPTRAVPVHLGVTQPRMAELAGAVADGVVCNGVVTDRWLREQLLPGFESGGAQRGPLPPLELGRMVRVGLHDGSRRERERAVVAVRRSLGLYAGVPYFERMLAFESLDIDDTRVADVFAVTGTVTEVCARLDEMGGVDWVELTPLTGLSREELREQYAALIDLLAARRGTPPSP